MRHHKLMHGLLADSSSDTLEEFLQKQVNLSEDFDSNDFVSAAHLTRSCIDAM